MTSDAVAGGELKWLRAANENTREISERLKKVRKMTVPAFVQRDNDTMSDFGRLKEKSKKNPLVPIGLAATASALIGGLYYLKRGDSRKQQLFMRYRVGAQFFTICAIIGGMAYLAHTQSSEDK